jgi:hypothetical protein
MKEPNCISVLSFFGHEPLSWLMMVSYEWTEMHIVFSLFGMSPRRGSDSYECATFEHQQKLRYIWLPLMLVIIERRGESKLSQNAWGRFGINWQAGLLATVGGLAI